MNETKLAARLKKKDEKALEEIILNYTALVSTIIYNVSNGGMAREDIEEVTSDVFVTLWNNSEKIQPDKLKGYICCIAKNKAKNKLKAVFRHQVTNIEEMDFEDGLVVSDEIENKVITEVLKEALDIIGEPDKEILIRHYYYYQSSTEISERMGMKSETVKSRIKRARGKLKAILTERGYSR